MVSADPEERPPAAVIASHPELCPTALRSRKELARELNEERFKNQQLAEYVYCKIILSVDHYFTNRIVLMVIDADDSMFC